MNEGNVVVPEAFVEDDFIVDGLTADEIETLYRFRTQRYALFNKTPEEITLQLWEEIVLFITFLRAECGASRLSRCILHNEIIGFTMHRHMVIHCFDFKGRNSIARLVNLLYEECVAQGLIQGH